MRTERPAASGAFQAVSGRAVAADFDGGSVTSDAGALPLGQADAAVGPVDRLAACFEDRRDGRFVEHSVRTLVGQRVFGIALGYEDLIDHDVLRGDPMMAVLVGKLRAKRRTCAPVAGKLRADSGFAREELMAWCEANGVDYLFGLARNERLAAQVADALAGAEGDSRESGAPARRFAAFMRSTRDSWSRERRVVGKAEWIRGKANPRFVVASLAASPDFSDASDFRGAA